jgi:nucleoside-diphosphate-sugar epimerase
LIARGDLVRCLVRSPERAQALQSRGVQLVKGGLDSAPAVADLVKDCAVVYHLAGLVQARNEAEFMAINRDATELLARSAEAAGVERFLYVSSLAAMGPGTPGQRLDEGLTPHPVTAYGRSKLAGEERLQHLSLPVTILRPPAVYGPHDWAMLRVYKMARSGWITLPGSGQQEISLIHAADLAHAMIAAVVSPNARGRVYHVAHDEVVSQLTLARTIASAVNPRARVIPLPAPIVRTALTISGGVAHLLGRATMLNNDKANEFLAPSWVCSSEALKHDTGWRAEIDLAHGVRETADWYQQKGWI